MTPNPLRYAQYLVSDDPEVLAIIERNVANRDAFFAEKVSPWAKERGATRVVLSADGARAIGLEKPPVGFGAWTQPKHGVSKPYQTNTVETEILRAIRVNMEEVPGVPGLVDSAPDSNGSYHWMRPTPFLHGGRAWVGLTRTPDPDRDEGQHFGPQWAECLSSEFHAAREAYLAQSKKGDSE